VIGALPEHREPVSRRFPFELCHFDHLGLLERQTPRTILVLAKCVRVLFVLYRTGAPSPEYALDAPA
jgi:hypothetical protein